MLYTMNAKSILLATYDFEREHIEHRKYIYLYWAELATVKIGFITAPKNTMNGMTNKPICNTVPPVQSLV